MTDAVVTDVQFQAQRGKLFAIAYRLLGSASDAEDVVQDAYLRWRRARDVRDAESYLVRVVTRLCLDELGSARTRREHYVGPWLPEPILTGPGTAEPLDTVEQRESVSFAVLLLLERLSPAERAVFILRGVFDYSYAEVAGLLELAPDYCRQLHRRARAHLAEERQRFRPSGQVHAALTRQLLAAATGGDLGGLEALLCEDVLVITDGGGRVRAALRPVVSRAKVARLLLGISRRVPAGWRTRMVEVNGQPAFISTDGERLTQASLVEARDSRAHRIYIVTNPDKLASLAGQLAARDAAPD